MTDHAPAAPVHFDAVLHPHRSLERWEFVLFMGLLGGISFGIGLVFLLNGAWPVFGFCNLNALLVYCFFRANYRAAELYETVRLTDTSLTIWRIERRGAPRSWSFQPYWVRVSMDDPPRHDSQIMLSSHGRSLVVGAFLTPDERLDFANALRAALRRWRDRPFG